MNLASEISTKRTLRGGGFTPAGLLESLQKKRKAMQVETRSDDETQASVVVLPPFESRLAILSAQRNKWKLVSLVSMGGAVLMTGGLVYLLNNRLLARTEAEYLVIPGAPEFTRVRPNLIPDAAVFSFAEFVATYAGTFSYRNARDHFATVAERMVPELKGRFLRDADAKTGEWERRRVDQVFSFDPIRRFDLISDKFGPKYSVVVRGTRTQYADGTLLQESDESLYLELRPHLKLTPGGRAEESLFHIERLEWVTRAQAETLLATRVREDPAKASK